MGQQQSSAMEDPQRSSPMVSKSYQKMKRKFAQSILSSELFHDHMITVSPGILNILRRPGPRHDIAGDLGVAHPSLYNRDVITQKINNIYGLHISHLLSKPALLVNFAVSDAPGLHGLYK